MLEDSNRSKRLPENWGIELVSCLQEKNAQSIYVGANAIGQRYVVRIQDFTPEREKMWKTLSRYHLPHLGQVIDSQKQGDKLYVLERFYCGESLCNTVQAGRRFGMRHMLLTLLKVNQDLATLYEHEAVLHLDIKPDNFLVDAYGNVILIDFGAALTSVHATDLLSIPQYGTPSYAAPERWQSPNQVGPPADLFSMTEVLKWWLGAEGIGSYELWSALSQWQARRQQLAEGLIFHHKSHREALEAYAEFEDLLLAYLV